MNEAPTVLYIYKKGEGPRAVLAGHCPSRVPTALEYLQIRWCGGRQRRPTALAHPNNACRWAWAPRLQKISLGTEIWDRPRFGGEPGHWEIFIFNPFFKFYFKNNTIHFLFIFLTRLVASIFLAWPKHAAARMHRRGPICHGGQRFTAKKPCRAASTGLVRQGATLENRIFFIWSWTKMIEFFHLRSQRWLKKRI